MSDEYSKYDGMTLGEMLASILKSSKSGEFYGYVSANANANANTSTETNQLYTVNPNTRVVRVCFRHELRPKAGLKFTPSKEYSYLCNFTKHLKLGDWVIVDSPTTGYTVVQVVNIGTHLVSKQSSNHKWIISRVKVAAYEKYVQQESAKDAENEKRIQKLLDLNGQIWTMKCEYQRTVSQQRSLLENIHKLEAAYNQLKA